MGKKGKGRQSEGFASKSLRANHHQEVQRLRDETLKWTRRETAGFVAWSNSHQKHLRRLRGDYQRPSFANALRRNLTGILDERRSLRAHQFRERRRRNGFLPGGGNNNTDNTTGATTRTAWGLDAAIHDATAVGLVHPPGWLLRYPKEPAGTKERMEGAGDNLPTLQTLSLAVFANYIRDYRSAMGDEELYGALSILPPESITELSVRLSSGTAHSKSSNTTNSESTTRGDRHRRKRNPHNRIDTELPVMYMDDTMAMLLGQHQHVEELCFRSKPLATMSQGHYSGRHKSTITISGLEALIPKAPVLRRQTRPRRRRQKNTENCETDDDGESTNGCESDSIPDCWDDSDECSSESDIDIGECFGHEAEGGPSKQWSKPISSYGGCNLRLRRLELLDLTCGSSGDDGGDSVDDNGNTVTAGLLLRWFERCSGITHLSLAGSFPTDHETGRTLVSSLPELLPSLEVLDVTRCPWATESLLARMLNGYHGALHTPDDDPTLTLAPGSFRDLPTVYYYKGIFEWLPTESAHRSVESDLWEESST